ncbi:hypothetical protein LIA77_08029 [Sarocladium implicatum]|nr:hypothetical protein LIA77_08029 [Sarocladium implicatum]
MQLKHLVTSIALLGGALAKHGCIKNHPELHTYSQTDALANLNAHMNAPKATHDTAVPYEFIVGQSKICLNIHSGGLRETVSNQQIAAAVQYIYEDCCSGGWCWPGWAELHVSGGYQTFAAMSYKDDDCRHL